MRDMGRPRIGIFGATGAVGKELIKVILERKVPFSSLRLFASSRSAGKKIETPQGELVVEDSSNADYSDLDIAFFAISSSWSKENAGRVAEQGCIVIDNSSAFRYEKNVPLVVPEINPEAIGDSKLIANPNCTTAIAAIPLWVVHRNFSLKKVFVSTYQAASGAGNGGMEELEKETRNWLEGKEPGHEVFQHPIAFNVIPHIDSFQDNDYTKEEMKVVWETRKIFNTPSLPISCTAVRIPTMRAHSESIIAETEKPVDTGKLRELLEDTEGVEVRDDPSGSIYPMPLTSTKKSDVEVGRIRNNIVLGKNSVEFFVSGDQLLKGAALNAVQIAEFIIRKNKDK